MKKVLSIPFLLFCLTSNCQTNPTRFNKVSITGNTENTTANRILVQDNTNGQIHYINKSVFTSSFDLQKVTDNGYITTNPINTPRLIVPFDNNYFGQLIYKNDTGFIFKNAKDALFSCTDKSITIYKTSNFTSATIQNDLITDNRVYNLPNQNGTFALDIDLVNGYVPYTGASYNIDINTKTLSFGADTKINKDSIYISNTEASNTLYRDGLELKRVEENETFGLYADGGKIIAKKTDNSIIAITTDNIEGGNKTITFRFPNKQNGNYTIATTEEANGAIVINNINQLPLTNAVNLGAIYLIQSSGQVFINIGTNWKEL